MTEQKKEKKKFQKGTGSKKIKNLVSAIILVSGLFVGSLFVDIVQLFQGGGFSEKNLNKTDVFEADGKTWVAYQEPGVSVRVVNDDGCEECDPAEVLVWLRRVMPTVSAEKVAFDSEEGRKFQEEYSLKSVPAFIFDKNVVKTDFYLQAQVLFEDKGDGYLFNIQELGLAPGRFLVTPEVKENDAILGNIESGKSVIVFSDFQCPYSKIFQASLRENTAEYEDRMAFVFKHLPLSFHEQALSAALASECANEQGKFWEYTDRLFDKQNEWSAQEGTNIFKSYASVLGLSYNQFSQCLDEEKYIDKIQSDMMEADSFGISGTPAIFVGEQFQNGAIDEKTLKDMIEEELNK